ncbi:DUF4157 domain-containing protein [Streptomyces sp. MNP-20]|uniref:eCIS core domain-containing protein n=1 Tax=Streptomyces sp. MNP-20 TaxID=2721165 RepID=UPI0028161C48|nr:DUF4157 domain-containing protein [Streptomyces sp. MNP-20]
MRAHEELPGARTGSAGRPRHPAVPAPSGPVRGTMDASEVMTIQRLAGNQAVARLLTEDRHAHGPGCGHGGAKEGGPADHQALLAEAIDSPTTTIPGPLMDRAESFYQNDFSGARFHDGPVAQRAIEAMGARAMTIGPHVFLPPGATQDLSLIGHEFSHLNNNFRGVPETGSANGAGIPVTDPNQSSERTADVEGDAFAAGLETAPSVTVQRAVRDGADRTDPHAPGPGPSAPVQRAAQGDPMDLDSAEEFGSSDLEELAHLTDTAPLERIRRMTPQERGAEFKAALRAQFLASGKWVVRSASGGEFQARTAVQGESSPRDFEDQPEVQRLRWIATVTKQYLVTKERSPGSRTFFNPVEVQAAIDGGGKLVIAANDISSNAHLAWLQQNGVRDLLGYMIAAAKRPAPKPDAPRDEKDRGERVNAHFEAAEHLHEEETAGHGSGGGAGSGGVVVARGGGEGLHAELRILAHNGGVTPEHLGGTKRPCATCFSKLYPDGSPKGADGQDLVRPGAFYSEHFANKTVSAYQDSVDVLPAARAAAVFALIDEHVQQTYVTLTKDGDVLAGYGSESDREN